jgi:hypothetical protein
MPTDDPSRSLDFYEQEYSAVFTTDMPSDDNFANLIANGFGGEKNYNDILKRLGLGRGVRIFDFGCSWSYCAFKGWPRVVASSLVTRIEFPSCAVMHRQGSLSGAELFFAARKEY